MFEHVNGSNLWSSAASGEATAIQIKNMPTRRLTAVLEQEWAMSICRH